jgi:hypothetical protein
MSDRRERTAAYQERDMPSEQTEIRTIAWSQVFPFARLFRTFSRAVDVKHLLLAFACVVACYLAGRILDMIWSASGSGVTVMSSAPQRTEVQAYAQLRSDEFATWQRDAIETYQKLVAAAKDTQTPEHRAAVSDAEQIIDQRVAGAVAAIDADRQQSSAECRRRRAEVCEAADVLRLMLAGIEPAADGASAERARALDRLLEADPQLDARQRAEQQGKLRSTIARQQQLARAGQDRPAGPFISLLDYELGCLASAIRGVCTGNLGLSDGAPMATPGMLGSIAAAGRGVLWLVTQRPWYFIFYAVMTLLTFAFFGGAICRSAAIQATRDESIPLAQSVRFACEKFGAFAMAPALPIAVIIGATVALFIGGLFAAIPWIGTLFGALLYGLAILVGAAIVFALLGLVLGLNLMWPSIAVEGSDAFDGVQHGAYVFQRPWHYGFYSALLLIYGGVCFLVVRVMAMLLLKVTHAATDLGMSFFGSFSSGRTDTIHKLDAMWSMPAWGDLTLLPVAAGTPFWGTFGTAPLTGAETLAMWLIAAWVFMVVGLVGAFGISFFFCGSVELYLLLRREIDAVDWDEVYYETPDYGVDTSKVGGAAAPAESKGTPLPVVTPQPVGTPPG